MQRAGVGDALVGAGASGELLELPQAAEEMPAGSGPRCARAGGEPGLHSFVEGMRYSVPRWSVGNSLLAAAPFLSDVPDARWTGSRLATRGRW